MWSMVTSGARHVPKGVPITAIHVMSTILMAQGMYMIDKRIGAMVASMMRTTVTTATSTMQTDAIDARTRLTIMAIVLSMTIRTDLMLSSIVPTRMSDCSSV
jgi:hypothetical protein